MTRSGIHRLAMSFALLLLAGCALRPVPPSLPVAESCRPDRFGMVMLTPGIRPEAMRRVFAPSEKKRPDAAQLARWNAQINQRVSAALFQALAEVSLPSARPVPAPAAVGIGADLGADDLRALQSLQPAGAYLRLRVSDYGETPRRWKSAYISFEVVTTLAIGAALYVHKGGRALAGVYLLQETVEEVGEGYAGFWALNRASRPVRIEMDLVDGQSGKVLWQDRRTGLARWEWWHLRHTDAATRAALLDAAMQKAVNALAADLARQVTTRCLSDRVAEPAGLEKGKGSE